MDNNEKCANNTYDSNRVNTTGIGSLAGYDPMDQQRKMMEITMELQSMKKRSNMDAKLTKIAELFELDVLDEEEALKACKMVISQHAKVRGKTDTKTA